MSDTISIEGPVQIKDASSAAVALELMKFIGDDGTKKDAMTAREYWLKLYYQCQMATSGRYSLDQVLKIK
jgi:hypothetical protein